MQTAVNARLRWRDEIWPLATIVILSAFYFFAFFNRFAGIRSGDGEFGGGITFLNGLRPYRDYFTAGPPLNQIKSAIELAVFGKYLIVTRTLAVVERMLIACTLYLWLRRMFSSRASLIAAIVTIIVSAGDRSDPLASYNHDAVFLAMLCGFVTSYAFDAVRFRQFVTLSTLAGGFAALSLLTKQTVGGVVVLAVLLFGAFAAVIVHGIPRCFTWCFAFIVGVSLPIFAFGAYLWHLHALKACIDMLFVSGPKAKAGSPMLFLSRELMVAQQNWMWLLLGLVALALSAPPVYRSIKHKQEIELLSLRLQWAIAVFGALVLVIAELLAVTNIPSLDDLGKASTYFTFIGTAIVGAFAFTLLMRSRDPRRQRLLQIALIALVSWSIAAALSLSWPAFEAMALPGLGLLLAAAIDGARKWGTPFLYLVTVATVFIQVREKLNQPFSFDHQDELPIRFETARSNESMLRGMRLAPETVRLVDDSLASIRQRSAGTIFTYPEMDIFYALSWRNPPTRTSSHNIDVVQDSFAREEAARLLAAPPAVVLYAKPTEENLRSDEHLWRQDRPSGQRDIVAAVDRIVSGYQLVGTYKLAPNDNPIRLYIRPQSDANTVPSVAAH